MNSTLRKVLIGAAAILFLCSWIGIGYTLYQELQAMDEYTRSELLLNLPDYEAIQQALQTTYTKEQTTQPTTDTKTNLSEITQQPEEFDTQEVPEEVVDEYAEQLAGVDVSILKKENQDVVGWIVIPDTRISYPLMQSNDNEYYLKRTWNKKSNSAGAIFLDYRSDASLNDFNSIIYGHKMRSGMMFSDLTNYSEQDYYEEHPSIYIVTETTVRRYDIFSSYEADVKNGHSYRLGLKTDEGRSRYIEYCLEASKIKTDITPTPDSSIITLSTCTQTGIYSYATRWVVHAQLAYETLIDSITYR